MLRLPAFRVLRPTELDEAVGLLVEYGEAAMLIAGGTDLVPNMKHGLFEPEVLVALSEIPALRGVRRTEDGGLAIGAMTSIAAVARDDDVRASAPALAQACSLIAGPQLRNMGTLGGNVMLDTRCLFYNQSEWWRSSNAFCLKHRGEVCHVAPSGSVCFAAYSGDVAPAMLVHEARAGLIGPDGRREIPLAELYRDDGMDHLTLGPGELLASVLLPKETAGIPSGYEKSRVRGSIDFPLAGGAVRLRMRNGIIEDIKVALTGVRSWPFALTGTEKFVGKALTDEILDGLRDMALQQSKPMRTSTIAPWYRRRVVGALTRRLVGRLAEG